MGGALKTAKGGFDGVFGQENPNATRWVLNGKRVPEGTEGATEVKDPWAGLSLRNRIARGALGGVAGGLQREGNMRVTWGAGHAPTYTFGLDDMPVTWQPNAGAVVPEQSGTPAATDVLPDAPEPNWAGQPTRRLSSAFYGR